MPRRFNDEPREPGFLTWSDVPRFYWMAMGVAFLMGLLSGMMWIAWNLVTFHVLR